MRKPHSLRGFRPRALLASCGLVLLLSSAGAGAQNAPVSRTGYPRALPPATRVYPEYVAPTRLSSPMEVFWEGVKQKESNGRHWRSKGVPLPGGADATYPGYISIGISQVTFTYRGQGVGPEKATDSGVAWNWDRYLYDPIYNERLGRGIFEKNMRQYSNNPCAAMWAYNAGDGAANALRDGRRSASGTPWEFSPGKGAYPAERNNWIDYVSKASAYSLQQAAKFGFANEVAEILQKTPGCSDKLVDVKPEILTPTPREPGPPVEGFCSPEAAALLAGTYKNRQDDLDATFEPLYREIKTGGEGVAGAQGAGAKSSVAPGPAKASALGSSMEANMEQLSSCVNFSWPNMSIQYPTMDQIIRGIAKEAVRRACGEARDALSEQRSRLSGSAYLNTRIPGVPSFGASTQGSGGTQPPGTP